MSGADDPEGHIAAEFRQCPGLRLTIRQAARLFNVDVDRAAEILERLVEAGVLVRTANGMFADRR